jgi:exopolyphosphatase/guanosine-5'-triphosphate,3'-diphosphate pyrophosphatase
VKLRGRIHYTPRRPELDPVAIVDIGSNSVRLVVYDGLRRAPAPIFNEKLMCALGRGVASTGRLQKSGIERALAGLARFRILCDQIGAKNLYAVATAAAREAKNGPAFIAKAEAALDAKINILSGKKEARLAAMGVLSGIPDADGLVGDLGGGSLELVDVRNGEIGAGVTLPLGPLRLMDVAEATGRDPVEIISEAFAGLDLLDALWGRNFYAVGGAWRNLGRLHMSQHNYPLNVLHHYTIERGAAQSLASLVARSSSESLRGIDAISSIRAETLPLASLVLEHLLERGQPSQMILSAYGLREGLLHSKLRAKKRSQDPLLSACWDSARMMARSPDHQRELCAWTDQLFAGGPLEETTEQRRLRHAACLLADTGWLTHPNYRGERSLTMVSEASFTGVDHPGRVFLALAVFFRYEGALAENAPAELLSLVDDDAVCRARIVAAAQRLSYVLSGAMPGMLKKIKFSFEADETLVLTLPRKFKKLNGERVKRRMDDLAKLIGRSPLVQSEKKKQ